MQHISLTRMRLFTQVQFFENSAITIEVMFLQVSEQVTALTNEFQQATAGCMVLFVAAEMFRQVKDAAREERDLYFRGTRIVLICTKFAYDFFLFFNT